MVNWVYVNASLEERLAAGRSFLPKDASQAILELFRADEWYVAPSPRPREGDIDHVTLTICRFLLRPNYIPKWLAFFQNATSQQSDDPAYNQYHSELLKDFQPIAPVVFSCKPQATTAQTVSFLVQAGFFEAALIDSPPDLSDGSKPWDGFSLSFQPPSEGIRVVPLVRFATTPTLRTLQAFHRDRLLRDHYWLGLSTGKHYSIAKIRDAWNALSDAQREEISPSWFKKVSNNANGAELVKKAVKRAKEENAELFDELRWGGLKELR